MIEGVGRRGIAIRQDIFWIAQLSKSFSEFILRSLGPRSLGIIPCYSLAAFSAASSLFRPRRSLSSGWRGFFVAVSNLNS